MKPCTRHSLCFALTTILAIVSGSPARSQSRIFVDADAAGADNGNSWTDAFVSLQDALSHATSGDEIWVAEGTYRPDVGSGIDLLDRSATFTIPSGTRLFGGFSGTEEFLDEREWQTIPTILSGDLLDNDPDAQPNSDSLRADNSRHVVAINLTSGLLQIDGFVIEGGSADESDPVGGGLIVDVAAGAKVTIVNSTRPRRRQIGVTAPRY